MKKNHWYGIASIVSSVLLFFPLFLASFVTDKKKFGEETSEHFFKLFDMPKDFNKLVDFEVLGQVITVVALICAVALLVVGILQIANVKAELLMGKIYFFGTIAITAVMFILSLIFIIMVSGQEISVSGLGKIKDGFDAGIGAILLAVFSFVPAICGVVFKFLLFKGESAPKAPKAAKVEATPAE